MFGVMFCSRMKPDSHVRYAPMLWQRMVVGEDEEDVGAGSGCLRCEARPAQKAGNQEKKQANGFHGLAGGVAGMAVAEAPAARSCADNRSITG